MRNITGQSLPSPWPSLPIQFPRPDVTAVLESLQLRYGDMCGYIELGVIDGDPSITRLRPPHNGKHWQRFVYTTPETRCELTELFCDLVERYGNVYVSLGLYRCRERTLHDLIGIQVLFLDDPKRELDEIGTPAEVLQTSPASQQHIYRFTRVVDVLEYQHIAMGAKIAAGAGANSSNPLHMVRLLGSVNTKAKYGKPFVGYIVASDPEATIDPDIVKTLIGDQDLLSSTLKSSVLAGVHEDNLPCVNAQATNANNTAPDELWSRKEWRDALVQEAAKWRPFVRSGRGGLLNSKGIPRGLRPHQIGYKILAGKIKREGENGNWDASGERYNVIESLMYVGYTNAQIAAIAEAKAAGGIEVKGSEAIWLDICRCICRIDARLGDKRRIRPATPPSNSVPIARSHTPRKMRGRPKGQRDAQIERLIALLRDLPIEEDGKCRTRGEDLARQLGVGARMVTNYLADLRRDGRLQTETEGRALAIVWVEINTQPTPQPPSHASALEMCDDTIPSERVEINAYDDTDYEGRNASAINLISTPQDSDITLQESTPAPRVPPTRETALKDQPSCRSVNAGPTSTDTEGTLPTSGLPKEAVTPEAAQGSGWEDAQGGVCSPTPNENHAPSLDQPTPSLEATQQSSVVDASTPEEGQQEAVASSAGAE